MRLKQGYFRRVCRQGKPQVAVLVGLASSIYMGAIWPISGLIYTKLLFSMFKEDDNELWDDVKLYSLYMFLLGVGALLFSFLQKFFFGIVSENVTKTLRMQLYGKIMRKHVGWFDVKDNNPGSLTALLAGEVQQVNGASGEAVGTILEVTFSLMFGIILAFIYAWRIALISLGLAPFFMLGGAMDAAFEAGLTNVQEAQFKEANLVVSDAIVNAKTVASFSNEQKIVETYRFRLDKLRKAAIRKIHVTAILYGFSQFVMYAGNALLFYCSALILNNFDVKGEDIFYALFAMLFGTFGAGQAQQFGPQIGKGVKAAHRVFMIVDEQSELDPTAVREEEILVDKKVFRGEVEFKNVWFRYPSRKGVWILKNFSLKLRPDQSVALVGQSGSGKSTIIQLLYRFYDPQFGTILVDGIDIQAYNLASLRSVFGLVSQEPLLFDYSIKDNITYGIPEATDKMIHEAAQHANALEFINRFSERGEMNDELAAMPEEFKERLHDGFLAGCGTRGGKLSGGQKQRIAIARAIIREPRILMLDEATSALDEESQRIVQEALDRVMVGRTSIVIAHRLSTVEKCDRVVVLELGHVVEDGKFQELKYAGGPFATLLAGSQ